MTLAVLRDAVENDGFLSSPLRVGGTVSTLRYGFASVTGLNDGVAIGSMVDLSGQQGAVRAEVVGLEKDQVRVAGCGDMSGVTIGSPAFKGQDIAFAPHAGLLGRIINAFGDPIDGLGSITQKHEDTNARPRAGSVLNRPAVSQGLRTGIRAIDLFTPLCFGQRIGIFAGSGVGKSTLLSMLAAGDAFDVIVTCLVGERQREVGDFVRGTLGPENLKKALVVVATSDEPAIARRRAPAIAMQAAQAFSRAGKRVLVLIDSMTRFAHAQREVGIALGEPPVSRGFPASVFSMMPKLLEQAGMSAEGDGSVTLIATVLVDGDDHNDPVADSLRGLLDGHLVMSRTLANKGHHPAIDPLQSISRLAERVWSSEQRDLITKLRSMMSAYEDTADLRLMGGWQPGSDPELDKAVEIVPRIHSYLQQTPGGPPSKEPFEELAAHLRGDQSE